MPTYVDIYVDTYGDVYGELLGVDVPIHLNRFFPPATEELPRVLARPGPDDRFWRYIRRGLVGSSVLKDFDGNYTTVSYPSQDQIALSAIVYLGGHEYMVDDTEAAALEAAGYTIG